MLDAGCGQRNQQLFGDFVVGARHQFAGVGVDHVVRQHAAHHEFGRHRPFLDARGVKLTDVLGGDALVLGNDDMVILAADIEARQFAAQALGHQFELHALGVDVEGVLAEEVVQNGGRGVAQRLQQNGDRHLAAAVDAEEQDVLGVELEVQPRAAVGNHARREQQLARAVRLAAVMLEEHAGRAVQLRHDHPLGAVDHERTGRRHQAGFRPCRLPAP